MTTPPLPCQSTVAAEVDLWFSDSAADQRMAASLCEGCPLSRYTECREEGWNHKDGVWGGLTPIMRKRMNRKRYDASIGRAEAESLYLDDVVVDVRAIVERKRLADAGVTVLRSVTPFEPDTWGAGLG